ncbi:MAG: hypothetical protein LBS01_00055 [Prevotellaceae bacterium]|jgi:hypothetical protein|nr:hypothetical protein [Prevotellaceae bacterium]
MPKKIISSTNENIKTSEQSSEVITTETYNFVDTTKKTDVEISYYKIEFYPPAGPALPDTIPENAVLPEGLNEVAGSIPISKPPPNIAGKGAIKSIESYTIKAVSEQTGRAEEKSSETINKTAQSNADITKTETITEQPAADPYRWRYIFGIVIVFALLAVGVYLGFRKSKFVISIISFLKNLF